MSMLTRRSGAEMAGWYCMGPFTYNTARRRVGGKDQRKDVN